MSVHVDELVTDVTVDGDDRSGGDAGTSAGGAATSAWEAAVEHEVARRRAVELVRRTASGGFDD